MMTTEKKVYKVFIASPGDLAEERRVFKEVIDELNDGFAEGADAKLEPLAWELAYSTVGRPPQSVFNEDVDRCDCFVLVLHRRWGQDAPDSSYSSYTEEEYHRALDRVTNSGQPRIFIFLKRIDPQSMADPGPQLAKVLAFRRELEQSNNVIYRQFGNEMDFNSLLASHLKALIKGELPQLMVKRPPIEWPDEAIESLQNAEKQNEYLRKEVEAAQQKAEAAGHSEQAAQKRAEGLALEQEKRDLQLARLAAVAADEGRVEEARQTFALATNSTTNLDVLYLGFCFFNRIGELDLAEMLMRRSLSISGPDEQNKETAIAWSSLGVVYNQRGDLDRAEEMHRKSLAIEQKLGRPESMAGDYGNLGTIYQIRGDLNRAEAMYQKSLAIFERLGRPEGMADVYCNLGIIYRTRGDLDLAKEKIDLSLSINEKLDRHEGMAKGYGNLGLIYQKLGDLDLAEEMLHKSLSINEKLGSLEDVAKAYGNLGSIYQMRSDFDLAEDMHCKSLAINETHGWIEGMAAQYSNLGIIYLTRGDLNKSEEIQRKSLKIVEKLGLLQSMANIYGSLGLIYKMRGNHEEARHLWTMARDLFVKLGISDKVKKIQALLDGLDESASE